MLSKIDKTTTLLFALVILSISSPLLSSADDFIARTLSVKDGLSQNTVTSMLRDSRGYLWVGTNYGLNRFDNNFTRQYYAAENASSIPNNKIYSIFEDKEHRIWSYGELGVAVYDHDTETFTRLTYENAPIKVRSSAVTDDGVILCGSGQILKYHYDTDSINIIPTVGGSTKSYIKITDWEDGKYLLQTRWDGIWKYDTTASTIRQLDFIKTRNILAFYVDSNLNIWLSPYGEGIERYDKYGNMTGRFRTSDGLSNDIVTDLLETPAGMLVASEKGVDLIDPETDAVKRNCFSGLNIEIGAVKRLYTDEFGNIHIGTVRNGVLMLHDVTMRTFRLSPPDIMENTITSFIKGKGDEIWCGIDGYGIVAFNTRTEESRPIESTTGMKVIGLADWPGNKVLVSGYIAGLGLVDKETETYVPAPAYLDQINRDSHSHAMGVNLFNLTPTLLAAVADSVYFIDTNRQTAITAKPDRKDLYGGKLITFYTDPDNVLVFQTKGIYRANAKTLHFEKIASSPDNTEIRSAQFDGKNTLFIATHEKVFRYDITTGKSEQLNCGQIRNISSLKLDNGKLWIGAANRLFLYKDGHTFSFDKGDGVVANEFLTNSNFKDSIYLYIGGTNGMARINRDETYSLACNRNDDSEFYLSELTVNHEPQISQVKDRKLTIPAQNSVVTIKAINKDSNPLRSKMYRFYVEGIKQPIEKSEPSITLNDLPSGSRIRVEISSILPDGEWSEPKLLIELHTRQVWWKSWWFILIVITVAAIILFAIFKAIRQRWVNIANLQRQHLLERNVEILANINESLLLPLNNMAAPLEQTLSRLDKNEPVATDEIRKLVAQTLADIDDMQAIVNTPSDMFHPQSHALTSMMLTARFNVWLQEQIQSFVRAQRTHKKIKYDFIPDCDPGTLTFNASRMELIISCILTELIEEGNDNLRISIAPDGTPNHLSIMFSAESNGTRKEDTKQSDNNKLRIIYARWIAELNDSHITTSLDSSGRLLSATLTLLARKSHETAARTESYQIEDEMGNLHEIVEEVTDISKRTLLLALADTELAEFIKEKASNRFKSVTICPSTKKAMSVIKSDLPDIIIADSTHDTLNGIKLCHQLKADEDLNQIPIILLTSEASNNVQSKAFKFGADAYLKKPFDINVLINLCRTLLANI